MTAPRPRVRILIPWFGAWPEWLPLFLETCRRNPSIEWLLLGDGEAPRNLPPNVGFEPLRFETLRERLRRRLGLALPDFEPYKLCDFRLAFGRVFAEQIAGCDYFGWGDLDVVYGDLGRYLTAERLDCDVLSFNADHLSGHLTLVRNGALARDLHEALPGWRASVVDTEYRHLDEPPPAALDGAVRVRAEESFNTPLSPKIPWCDGRFVFPSVWTWRAGRLTNDLDGEREFPYLHFMHWKGGWWPRSCGNAQWERLERLVHFDAGRAADGFRISADGFTALSAPA